MRSLRRFIAASLIALAALPSILTALFAGQLIKANVTAGIEASLSALAGSVAMESELYLRTSSRLLDALARFLKEDQPPGAVQGFVASLAASHEEVSAMVLLDERARVEVIAPAKGPVLGDDFSRQPAYMAARRNAGGEAVFSTPYISPIDGKVTVAVYRSLGSRTGLVLLALDKIGSFFEGLRVSPRDAVALVDGDNRFIAHTDKRHVEEQRFEFRSRERGMAETEDDGRKFLLLSRKVPGHEWKALYYRDREEAYALLGGFIARLAAMAVAATLLALAVAARAGRAMTSPFSDISAKMREVAAGRYSDRIGGRWSEEFDAIAETFNTMAESVERRDLALSASEARYRSLFYDSRVPSLLVDPATGAVREANAAAAVFYGYLPEELAALRIQDIDILPARQLRAEMAKARAANRQRLLFRHRRKDGAFRDVEVYSAPVEWEGQTLLHCLVFDVTERTLAEERVKRSLDEKVVLLKEIHHRVKNNLQIVASLLNLQARYIKDPDDAALFRASQNRIYSMSLTHELLYQAPDLACVDMAEYGERLLSYLRETEAEAGFRPESCFDHVSLPIERAIPCGLVLNELVTNAIKYAKDAEGETSVRVSLLVSERDGIREARIEVSDRGPGLPAGVDPATSSSLGFSLVTSLAQQLDGRATWTAVEPGTSRPGTCAAVSFPLD